LGSLSTKEKQGEKTPDYRLVGHLGSDQLVKVVQQQDQPLSSFVKRAQDHLKVGVADFFLGEDALNHLWGQVPFSFAEEEGQ
jgi:hypothetical protein